MSKYYETLAASADIGVGVLCALTLNRWYAALAGGDLPAMWAVGLSAAAAVAFNACRAGVRINWSPVLAAVTGLGGLLAPWAAKLWAWVG